MDEVGWGRKVVEMGWGTDKDGKGKKGGCTMTVGELFLEGDLFVVFYFG